MTFPVTPRATYEVTATREDRWWILEVEGVGTTQVRRLAEARAEVVDLIATMTDAEVPDTTRIGFRIGGELGAVVRDASQVAAAAEAAQKRASEATRAAVRLMVEDEGLPQSDVAVAMNLSKQRVSQLVHS